MNLDEAETLANDLIDEHLGYPWQFGWDNAKRRFGCCWYGPRRITLSRLLADLNSEEEVRQTILHEIAHAKAYEAYGATDHGPRWKSACAVLGIQPDRCYNLTEEQIPEQGPPRWAATCPGCGYTVYRRFLFKAKAAKDMSCGKCSPGGFSEEFRMGWRTNPAFLLAGGKER